MFHLKPMSANHSLRGALDACESNRLDAHEAWVRLGGFGEAARRRQPATGDLADQRQTRRAEHSDRASVIELVGQAADRISNVAVDGDAVALERSDHARFD